MESHPKWHSKPRSLATDARDSRGPRHSNALIAALPNDEFAWVTSRLMPAPLVARQVLLTPDRPLDVVYFPGGGVCSMGVAVPDGSMVEVSAIGCEGMVGIEAVLGGTDPIATVVVHVGAMKVFRMPVAVLRDALDINPTFRDLLMRYTQAMLGSVVHAAACNRLHSADQRLARALLVMHDRVSGDAFPFTQDMLAVMLGFADRPSQWQPAHCSATPSSNTSTVGLTS